MTSRGPAWPGGARRGWGLARLGAARLGTAGRGLAWHGAPSRARVCHRTVRTRLAEQQPLTQLLRVVDELRHLGVQRWAQVWDRRRVDRPVFDEPAETALQLQPVRADLADDAVAGGGHRIADTARVVRQVAAGTVAPDDPLRILFDVVRSLADDLLALLDHRVRSLLK